MDNQQSIPYFCPINQQSVCNTHPLSFFCKPANNQFLTLSSSVDGLKIATTMASGRFPKNTRATWFLAMAMAIEPYSCLDRQSTIVNANIGSMDHDSTVSLYNGPSMNPQD